MSQISEIVDVNGNLIEEGKEPIHPSKLTLTEALAAESGGTENIEQQNSPRSNLILCIEVFSTVFRCINF